MSWYRYVFNNQEAFWMPPRSVRAALALLVMGTICSMLFYGKSVPGPLWALGGVVLRDYFETRRPNGSNGA